MNVKKIHLDEPYDFYLTLYPSFIYPLFEFTKRGSSYIIKKSIGALQGSSIIVDENLVCYKGLDHRVVEEWLGLWFKPWSIIGDVEEKYLGFIENVLNKFSSIRIAISPLDRPWVFIAVFLSHNTSFHVNTVKWIKKIGSVNPVNPLDINPLVAGKNYQLVQLSEILDKHGIIKTIVSSNKITSIKDAWRIRMKLLEIKYVGPKTADAFLLFTTRYSIFTPSDRHYRVFVSKYLGVRRNYPLKKYCKEYTCDSCPLAGNCLTGWSISVFGRLSGWLQTLSYLHGNKLITL